jgi:transposase-like protein
MKKESIDEKVESRVCFEHLEDWVREKIQSWVQELLEEEVTELLGRGKSERRKAVDAPSGYRNGYGKRRRLTLSCGTIAVRRPRVREVEERFESRVLPLFAKRTREVRELIPELYLHGLAQGDFDLALRGLLGEEAPLSASTVARLKEKWQAEMSVWQSRPLEDLEVVYVWADGVYVKAGLEKEKAAVLVVLAALSDGRKVIVSVTSGYRESTQSWSEVLRDLKRRGMNCPRLVIADGHLGIWGALRNVYPEAQEQRCWNHRILNALGKVPKRLHKSALLILRQIPYAETRQEAERLKKVFQQWCRQRDLEPAAALLDRDWERMVAFYNYPKAHWQHLRTTNPVESPFAALRLRTDAAKRFKKVANAQAMIWKMLMVAEKRFRRLKSPHLMKDVYRGDNYVNGMAVKQISEGKAA